MLFGICALATTRITLAERTPGEDPEAGREDHATAPEADDRAQQADPGESRTHADSRPACGAG